MEDIRKAREILIKSDKRPCFKKGCEQPFEFYVFYPGCEFHLAACGEHSTVTMEEFMRHLP